MSSCWNTVIVQQLYSCWIWLYNSWIIWFENNWKTGSTSGLIAIYQFKQQAMWLLILFFHVSLDFRCSLWFLHLRIVLTVTQLCAVSRLSLQLSRRLTTTSPMCLPWPRPPAPACTLTRPPPRSPPPLRPWSSCWAAATPPKATPLPPMQQHTPQPPLLPGGTRPAGRIQSVVCCTASRQPTSISSPLVPPTSVWHHGQRPTVPTRWAPGASRSTPTYRRSHTDRGVWGKRKKESTLPQTKGQTKLYF